MTIGLIGTFQVGKSTLVNCLLGETIAACGHGLPTTHILQAFSEAKEEEECVRFLDAGDRVRKDVTFEHFLRNASVPEGTRRVDFKLSGRKFLRGNQIVDAPGLDSVGEDASGDDQLTNMLIPTLDCALLVLPPTMVSEPVRKKVLKPLAEAHVPVIAVMNCSSPMQPDPNAKFNQNTAARIDLDIRRAGIELLDLGLAGGSRTLACNIAWYWVSHAKSDKDQFPDDTTREAFCMRKTEMENYFRLSGKEVPTPCDLDRMSNVPYLLVFLLGGGVRRNNNLTRKKSFVVVDFRDGGNGPWS